MGPILFGFLIAAILTPTIPDHYDRLDAILSFFKLWICFGLLITFGMLIFGY